MHLQAFILIVYIRRRTKALLAFHKMITVAYEQRIRILLEITRCES